MIHHIEINTRELYKMIERDEIVYAGNNTLKIYGTLRCKSGKRMKIENRVFFSSTAEAEENGFRPCGNCMKIAYKNWKNGSI
ncbi:Ada metal-binding domain-containing protein [Aquimarina longa]|uniref:Ada metal-binding domain-containing protein n=1 Tax=Aquimarina longa TaxID=1080221 RepID=UPI0007808FE5|nr:Ada metal-binding domain-containing protein [Aquimarina longa]